MDSGYFRKLNDIHGSIHRSKVALDTLSLGEQPCADAGTYSHNCECIRPLRINIRSIDSLETDICSSAVHSFLAFRSTHSHPPCGSIVLQALLGIHSRMKVKGDLLHSGQGLLLSFTCSTHSRQSFFPQGQLMTHGSFRICRQTVQLVSKISDGGDTNSQSYSPVISDRSSRRNAAQVNDSPEDSPPDSPIPLPPLTSSPMSTEISTAAS